MQIKRSIYKELLAHLKEKEITLIVGPRQAGKTTLMRALEDDLKAASQKTLFFNLDVEADAYFFQSQARLQERIKLEFGDNPGTVFIDEIQRKENAGLFLKGLYDQNLPYKLVVSGSGSLELKEKTHESLVGRKRLFELLTVDFFEFADYKTGYAYTDRLEQFFQSDPQRYALLLDEHMTFGGYPRVILADTLSEKSQIMNDIYRSYIEKDIAYLLNLNQPESFSFMIKILASQTGNILHYTELSKQVGVSAVTIKKYLWYAEKTYIIKLITPFFANKQKEITKSSVVYFYDLGLRNFSIDLFGKVLQQGEKGFLFQNAVALVLSHSFRHTSTVLQYWRTKDGAEIDFVLSEGTKLSALECKYSFGDNEQIPRAFKTFPRAHSGRIIDMTIVTAQGSRRTADNFKIIPFYSLSSILENRSIA